MDRPAEVYHFSLSTGGIQNSRSQPVAAIADRGYCTACQVAKSLNWILVAEDISLRLWWFTGGCPAGAWNCVQSYVAGDANLVGEQTYRMAVVHPVK